MQSLPAPNVCLAYDDVVLQFVKIVPGEPSRGFVPYYHFRILNSGNSDVGHINFRVGDTEHVKLIAGHIGFEVREPFRGHGYAQKACRAIAPFVRSMYGEVTITCDPSNIPSRVTIESLGAQFVDVVPIPKNDPSYKRGLVSKERYRWHP